MNKKNALKVEKLGKIYHNKSSKEIRALNNLNDVGLEEVNSAAAKIYNTNNFILLVMGKRDSCAIFLEQFANRIILISYKLINLK